MPGASGFAQPFSVSAEGSSGEGASTGVNVIGRLPAHEGGAPTPYAIVLGAHYDHLGQGGAHSLRPDAQQVHPGADDNASGVAAIIEMAEALSAIERVHDVYVIAFDGEEQGFLGSTQIAQGAGLAEGTRVGAMINFDMIGRLRDDRLVVGGADSSPQFRDLIRRAQAGTGLDVMFQPSARAMSDHAPFLARRVPSLYFHTGTHEDYHTPDDTIEGIDARGASRVLAIAFEAIAEIVASPRLPLPARIERAAPDVAPRVYDGAYLGSIPDMRSAAAREGAPEGALIGGTQPNSPAERAGLKAGDRITTLGSHQIEDLRGLSDALRAHEAGDEVTITGRARWRGRHAARDSGRANPPSRKARDPAEIIVMSDS